MILTQGLCWWHWKNNYKHKCWLIHLFKLQVTKEDIHQNANSIVSKLYNCIRILILILRYPLLSNYLQWVYITVKIMNAFEIWHLRHLSRTLKLFWVKNPLFSFIGHSIVTKIEKTLTFLLSCSWFIMNHRGFWYYSNVLICLEGERMRILLQIIKNSQFTKISDCGHVGTTGIILHFHFKIMAICICEVSASSDRSIEVWLLMEEN